MRAALLVFLAAQAHGCAEAVPHEGRHHVLFIATDDMRPELSPYGHNHVSTPALEGLAGDGFLFRRAYVQQALCAPSRTVILTGRRPDTSRVWAIGPYFRDTTLRNVTTLPQAFKQAGYRSIGHGKIFHEGNASGYPLDQDQEYGSWSVPFFHPKIKYDHWNKSQRPSHPQGAPLSYAGIDKPWQTFNDASSALTAVEWIKNASAYENPFFLAVGFHRPHIPYVYPKEFEFTGEVDFPPENHYIAKNVPPCAMHDYTSEASRYGDLSAIRPPITDHNFQHNLSSICTAVPLGVQRNMKRAYLSSIQYIDHLVGVLLSALKEEGIYETTHIVFWGDHGYKLGEHCDWFKHDNYEDSTRIPLIVKPSTDSVGDAPRGREVPQFVEEVDIFPSLLELAGLPAVQALEGQSWVPLLARGGTQISGKQRVFSQYPHFSEAHRTQVMGYSMRTPQWRYTEWLRWNCSVHDPMSCDGASVVPQWSKPIGVELYNHSGDPSRDFTTYENENLADQEDLQDIVAQLHEDLKTHWPRGRV